VVVIIVGLVFQIKGKEEFSPDCFFNLLSSNNPYFFVISKIIYQKEDEFEGFYFCDNI